ncbi:hypothetical protein SAMN00120144_1399 [Hymenobacter roseosalivarius DSM 11622]|uniref:Uncharacterized protein n=1 Tax=Hymenobacter roseosalivarius DSM 11622 TaxID=645990 RepID=A0A1W1V3T9_9BACT|nr:hypothetical protein [Hymenobacter roseosalivarius]SMB87711.1 hypothetical protein SAMN00120144_1399 [Hymenobacter roseosalivarius DSM 11622]
MKLFLSLLLGFFFINSPLKAQSFAVDNYLTTMPSNKEWGWFLDESSTRKKYVQNTGYQFSSEKDDESFGNVKFLNMHDYGGISFDFLEGTLIRVTFAFPADKFDLESWTKKLKKVKADTWSDYENNAIITVKYSGNFILYTAECDMDAVKAKTKK